MPENTQSFGSRALWVARHMVFGSFIGAYRARRGLGWPKHRSEWEAEYADGNWAYLEGIPERSHHMVVLGYLLAAFDRPSVLDAGCGTGTLLRLLGGFRIASYEGIDTSRVAITRARACVKRLEPGFPATFRVARFEDFDSRSQYHAIVFNESLSYVRDPLALLNSFVRFLRPDGIFIISLCYNWWQAPMLDRITRAYDVKHSADIINEQGLTWRVRVLQPDSRVAMLPATTEGRPRPWPSALAERSVIIMENAAAIAGLLPRLFGERRKTESSGIPDSQNGKE